MGKPVIPVSAPDIGELEIRYVSEAVRSGWVSSIGAFVERFETGFAEFCGTAHGVAVSNGTDALMLTLCARGIGPGDEVIVPAFTFAAVPAVVLHLGATPVLADVTPEYWCMDPAAVERAITERTRAIVAVHAYGHPVDMDPILEMARERGIFVVEDAAEAHGARYRGTRVGGIGDAGCFSFYGNKIVTCGEGGAVVTHDEALARQVRYLRDHAQDPGTHYYHSEAGFNCRLTNLQAALGCAQLERIDTLLAKKGQILSWYQATLGESLLPVTLNPSMTWAQPVVWMVCVLLTGRAASRRSEILARLRDKGVDTRPFFVPVAQMPPYRGTRSHGAEADATSVAAEVAAAGFNLPSGVGLTRDQVEAAAEALREALS